MVALQELIDAAKEAAAQIKTESGCETTRLDTAILEVEALMIGDPSELVHEISCEMYEDAMRYRDLCE